MTVLDGLNFSLVFTHCARPLRGSEAASTASSWPMLKPRLYRLSPEGKLVPRLRHFTRILERLVSEGYDSKLRISIIDTLNVLLESSKQSIMSLSC